MKNFFLAATIVFAIISVLIFLVAGLDPRQYWLFSICSLFIPVIFFINILLALIWLVFHWRFMFIPLATLLAGYYHMGLFISMQDDETKGKCLSEPFSVMSFNMYGLKLLKHKDESKFNANKSRFLSFIRNNDPDVLCVQENNLFADDMITKSEVFPYTHYIVQHGAAIYSKHPFLDQGKIDFGTKTNSCLWADVLIRGKKLRVYSIHLQSNRVSKDLEKMKDEQEENNSAKLGLLRRIFGNYKRMAIIRAEQAEKINEHAKHSVAPVIMCGDFNDTPFSFPYNVLTDLYRDSFLARGKGLGSTFVGLLPGLRIDYVLADRRKFDFCYHRVLQTPFSDHSPVFVKLIAR
jgi:endonuclease/exonuclease/phosphatase family metal-dependent hydrolase